MLTALAFLPFTKSESRELRLSWRNISISLIDPLGGQPNLNEL